MIEFATVSKVYPGPEAGTETVAVRDLDLRIGRGEFHCLIGTSGCGKTTTLKMVNRLVGPTSGRVVFEDRDVAELDVIALRRRIGYVIQSGGLFPHMTVAGNVGLLMRLDGCDPQEVAARVGELLELVRLEAGLADRRPGDLSGGQRQRIGVARALLLDPDVLLLDEPFGALDPITRRAVRDEIGTLVRRLGKTVLMVTHDLDEAFALADRVSLMHHGRLVQTGSADDLRQRPASAFVARFVAANLPAGDGNGGGDEP